jgi:hypothetical protein
MPQIQNGSKKWWSEAYAPEDFELSLNLQIDGKRVQYTKRFGDGFQEGVTLTVYDELRRWGLLLTWAVITDGAGFLLQIPRVNIDTRSYCRYRRLLQIPGFIADAGGYCGYKGLLLSCRCRTDVECYCWRRELLQIQEIIAGIEGFCWELLLTWNVVEDQVQYDCRKLPATP